MTDCPAYNLARLANAHPDVIFVSFNYRLNALGFPFSPALESLNAGLRDQRLAVEWVYNNIEAFGGDPDRIVMGGESVGASSVAAYLYSFKNETLLNGAFTMSGTEKLISNGLIGPFDPKPNHTDSFQAFANGAGCQLQGEDFAGQLNCLREADTEAIYKGVIQDKVKKLAPHYDEELVFTTDEYARKAVSGDFARIVGYLQRCRPYLSDNCSLSLPAPRTTRATTLSSPPPSPIHPTFSPETLTRPSTAPSTSTALS